MMRSRGVRAGLGLGRVLVACVLAGCATRQWVARDAFGDKYSCPAEQVSVRSEAQATTPSGLPIPDTTNLSVGGCGVEAKYRCHNAGAGRGNTNNVCVENSRFGIQATDGSVYTATASDAEAARAPEKAAVASAAHDIPCPRASIRVVGREPMVVEGCGQRLTYKEEEHESRAAAGVHGRPRRQGLPRGDGVARRRPRFGARAFGRAFARARAQRCTLKPQREASHSRLQNAASNTGPHSCLPTPSNTGFHCFFSSSVGS